jgi:mRNA interferase RelE/StbE
MAGRGLFGLAYTRAALEFLEKRVPNKIRGQITRKVRALLNNPHPPGCKLIHNTADGKHRVYRIRQGDYRVLYSVRIDQIVVLDIDNRKDVYRGAT